MTRRITTACVAGFAALALAAGCSSADSGDTSEDNASTNASGETTGGDGAVTVTDSVGREVTLDAPATTVATAGPPSEVLLYTFDTDDMAGWNRGVSPERAEYIPDELQDLPEIGRISSDGGDLDVEGLLNLGVDLIIDAGNVDDTYIAIADDLQEQTGIPVLQFSTDPADLPEVYKTLGTALGDEERGEELASATQEIVDEVAAGAESVSDPVSVYYASMDNGLETAPSGSIHSRIIDMIGGKNAADITSDKGSGRVEIDFEQLLGWDPDAIIFGPNSNEDPLASNPEEDADFGTLSAIKDGNYYVAPVSPFGWFDGPPSANQLMGAMWAAEAIYPDNYDFDLKQETIDFYSTFYHVDLSDEQAEELLEPSGVDF